MPVLRSSVLRPALAAWTVGSLALGASACSSDDEAEPADDAAMTEASSVATRDEATLDPLTDSPGGDADDPGTATTGTVDAETTAAGTTGGTPDEAGSATVVTDSADEPGAATVPGGTAEGSDAGTVPVGSAVAPDDFQIDSSDVDDEPVCRAFADVFNVIIGVSLVEAFAGFGEEMEAELGSGDETESTEPGDGAAGEPATETAEVALYPSLLDDIEVLEDEAPSEVNDAFDAFFERVRAVPPILEEAGFTSDEIDELARVVDVSFDQPDAADEAPFEEDDPRLAEAASLLLEREGSFADVGDSTLSSDGDEADAVAEEFFGTRCPTLSSTLEQM